MSGEHQTTPLVGTGNAIFAVPKKGRLFEQCMKMLEGAGLKHQRASRLDIAECIGLPVTLVFLPAQDIATYVGEGNVDLGITGFDIVQESGESGNIDTVLQLGFGKCSLCVQAPISSRIKDPATLAGKRIATSYPHLTQQYFATFAGGMSTEITNVSGSVEAACGLGLADAVVDLVESGNTMRAAGLELIAVICQSESVLIASKHTTHRSLVQLITRRIQGYMTAERCLMISYNVSKEAMLAAQAVTPGKRSPTVTQLEEEGWFAVQSIIDSECSAEIMDKLAEIGATDILLFSLNNCRMGYNT